MNIKYIFCISTGRSGTAYLSNLLGQLEGCNAYHEQKPVLHNKAMRKYMGGDKSMLKEDIPAKIYKIKNCDNSLYVDTSHIFIKSFGWEIPHYISQNEIGIVILKRNKDKVVSSTQRVHSGPFTYLGRKWILAPYKKVLIKPPVNYYEYHFYRYLLKLYWLFKREKNSIVKTYPKFFENKSLKLIEWYYEEIYALGLKYQKKFPEINYVTINLEELNSIEGFEKIVKSFDLNEVYDKKKVEAVIGKATNLKKEFKIK